MHFSTSGWHCRWQGRASTMRLASKRWACSGSLCMHADYWCAHVCLFLALRKLHARRISASPVWALQRVLSHFSRVLWQEAPQAAALSRAAALGPWL